MLAMIMIIIKATSYMSHKNKNRLPSFRTDKLQPIEVSSAVNLTS
jgi:hypothetical protein